MRTITLPQATKDMTDATVIRWLKAVSESVAAGEALVEVQTVRDVIQIQADQDGVLAEILAPAGHTAAVGEPIARMDSAGAPAPAEPAAPTAVEAPTPTPAPEPVGDVTPIIMPKAGNTMEEGAIIAWRVKEGDTINVGDVIFEVETDKAAVEVEAADAGRLAKIVAAEGDIVEVFKPVAYLADKDADVEAYIARQGPAAAPAAAAPAPAVAPATAAPAPAPATAATKTGTGRVKASPAARKLAAQRNIDLAAIGAGSGPGGRILSTDVPVAAAAPVTITPGVAGRAAMSSMRKAIATNLQVSKQTIPHFYIETTIAADAMMTFYRARKAEYPCTVNDLVVRACGIAINEFAPFRSRIEGGDIVTEANANIGVAVGMDEGLVVPVVLAVENLNLQQTAVETRKVVDAARNGKIPNMGRGVFTISNMGMFGVHRFAAIINPPESGILAVGAVREDTIVVDGAIKPARVMTVTLSCDHRVVDGMVAAQFLNRLKELLESPEALV